MVRRPLLTSSQRAGLLSICFSLFGFAIAVAAYPLWLRPAPAGQLPGLMTSLGLDAHASFRFFASMVVLTIAAAVAARPLVALLEREDTRAWARNGVAAATIGALVVATISRSALWTFVPAAIAIAACVVLRRVDAGFTRRDAILVPTIAAVFVSLLDASALSVEHALVVAAMLGFAVRLAIAAIRRSSGLAAPLCFAFAPAGLILQSHLLGRGQRYAGWPAIVLALITPFVLRILVANTARARRNVRLAIVFLIYPIAAFGYASATSLTTAEGRPRANFFEDGQHLAPAGEVLRGEKPYRDIVPPHGLIQDALFDAAFLRHGPVTMGTALKARGFFSAAMSIAAYALAAVATGSADAAVFVVFVAAMMTYATGYVRFFPSVVALIFAAAAARRRSRVLLLIAGAMTAVAFFMSIDSGVYAFAATLAAAVLFERDRPRAFGAAGIGAAIVFAPAIATMAIAGFASDFFRVTFSEIPRLAGVYAQMPFMALGSFDRPLPGVLLALFDARTLLYFIWIAALVSLGVLLARWKPVSRPAAALVVMAAWIVAAGISYAERHHLYFYVAAVPLIAGTVIVLRRTRNVAARTAAGALIVFVVISANPIWHIAVTAEWRRADHRGPTESGWRELGLPRARGAWFRDEDAAVIDSVYRYSQSHLRPGETFFDFTNRALLYFLLDRDIPVRHIEVTFYEPADLQREVIARIENNPRIRFAIVPVYDPPTGVFGGVDEVRNAARAPLVWQYLQQHFEPDFREGEVEIWKRK